MNRENAAKLWPLIKAFGEGRTVQFRDPNGNWGDYESPAFDWIAENYRIKLEPRRKWYIEWTDGSAAGPFDSKWDAQGAISRRVHGSTYKLVQYVEVTE